MNVRLGERSGDTSPARSGGEKVRIEGLGKSFGAGSRRTTALQDFSLTIDDGEFICIVGPSGCGKTTALRIVAGLEQPTVGSVRVVPSSDQVGRPLNAMVFQEHGLFPWLTVIDNVAFGLEVRGLSRRERHRQVEPFLKTIGLLKFRDHYPGQLSGGMRQRVSLARALVTDPEVLLMDEPFAALDAQNRILMQDELLRLWEDARKTVVFITHSIDEAIALSDRIVVMSANPGRIKEVIPVPFARPRSVAELRADVRFGELSLHIWRSLKDEVQTARQTEGIGMP
ncbi:ABC transporter ATP-binding protein [Reyranella sp. CPCC 100927]|uniref:ABC transporter ATP-binding protein n=1 Tax=Reyranella sp. CPCC 100927 TaxID=2599616 RepID=UPI0011B6C646|nr:ABC transporter ATP-binding protein [Reyranella sp. CPCC 100927]TWS99834.1 ABC transporter ATP-binding protein [Reyranella sp. CPCC 100927]